MNANLITAVDVVVGDKSTVKEEEIMSIAAQLGNKSWLEYMLDANTGLVHAFIYSPMENHEIVRALGRTGKLYSSAEIVRLHERAISFPVKQYVIQHHLRLEPFYFHGAPEVTFLT